MAKYLIDFIKSINEINPPKGLELAVLSRIEKEIKRKIILNRIFGGLFSFISIIALVPLAIYTTNEFYQSGFFSFMSLLFSDSKIVFSNFGEYALSIVDSVPLLAITLTLLSVQALLVSVRYIFNNERKIKIAKLSFN